jgi:predicted lipoprotein with Yx(FWY)xxD motif
MTRRMTLVVAVAGTVAGLAGTAACGRPGRAELTVPVAATRAAAPGAGTDVPGADPAASDPATSRAPDPALSDPLAPPGPPEPAGRSGAGGSATGSASASASPTAPVPEPTVARTQKWVKIFSGPSATGIVPPASITKGSRTVELEAAGDDRVGDHLTDGAGRTLYVFGKDSARPPRSVCNGSCATAWPPLLIKSPGRIFPSGVDPRAIGYVERADHTCQVTVNGHPLYYFVADAKPGDVNGQGINGTWFAAKPDGTPTTAVPAFPGR